MEKHDKFGKFKCGMEVTLFMKDKPLKGTIKFIGKAAGEDEMSFGIELVSLYHIWFLNMYSVTLISGNALGRSLPLLKNFSTFE